MLPALAVVAGLVLLVWSAGLFVDGAAAMARRLGVSSLLIGMVVIGFGTSAPEVLVSIFAAVEGNPGLALGNAYGSNIANICLILGAAALVSPLAVNPRLLRRELPLLAGATIVAGLLMINDWLSRLDALILVGVFAAITIYNIKNAKKDAAAGDDAGGSGGMTFRAALVRLAVGLGVMLASSRLLVWGAVELAHLFGVSDLVIGLTIVAVGTSLPELASSIIAARKGEHDLALGNVVGSNFFNTLIVVGVAGAIRPIGIPAEFFRRDFLFALVLTFSLFAFCARGGIGRAKGVVLLLLYAGYIVYLLKTAAIS